VSLLRVVLDINIVISAYFFSKQDSPPRLVLQAALDKRYRLLHSSTYRDDLRRALSKDKFVERLSRIESTVDDIVETILLLGDTVEAAEVASGSVRDEDDSIILACAAGGNANYVVTGDEDLLVLKSYKGIQIVSPAQFLTILTPPASEASETSTI
jgi:putative PIN family toxin of toxin-antitoxin system